MTTSNVALESTLKGFLQHKTFVHQHWIKHQSCELKLANVAREKRLWWTADYSTGQLMLDRVTRKVEGSEYVERVGMPRFRQCPVDPKWLQGRQNAMLECPVRQ
jgi:hypothetical protein